MKRKEMRTKEEHAQIVIVLAELNKIMEEDRRERVISMGAEYARLYDIRVMRKQRERQRNRLGVE